LLTGILFGISPAWQLSRPQLGPLIQSSSTKMTGSTRGRNLHRLLIAGQVALTLLLIAGAGSAMKSFVALTHTPLGFDPDHVLSFDVTLPKGAKPSWQGRLNSEEAVRVALEQTPGVSSAGISASWFPPFGGFRAKVEIQSKPTLSDSEAVMALVSPELFSTLHVPLLTGRIFNQTEVMNAAHLALVNQAFVREYFADRDPLGQSVRSPMLKFDQASFVFAQAPDDWLQVVGIVGDTKNDGLQRPVKPMIFLPYTFVLPPDQVFFVRSSGDPETTIRSIRQRLREVSSEFIVADSPNYALAWRLDTQGWGQERFIATLFGLFAFLALALAATGLYSVVSFVVTRRTQELGIRMALGARRGSVIQLVLASTAATLGIGIAVGLGLSVILSRLVMARVGSSSRDPLTLLLAASLLFLVAVLACAFPAWRAASIEPMRALRTE
jgi:predicted permease